MTAVDLSEHRSGPTPDEPPYTRSCLRCGEFWPCPAYSERLRAEAAEMHEARRGESRRIGVLALVDLGVTVWSSTRRDAYDFPLGGTIVEIEDQVDRGTGEITRRFTCLKLGNPLVVVRQIDEAEVKPDGVEATQGAQMAKLVKAMAQEVADTKASFLGTLATQRIRWMYTLAGLVAPAA